MKQLSWKLVLPLTIISFSIFTKWRYVVVVDGWDMVLTGFPLPYASPGFHTSLSLQIFVLELIFDLVCYYVFWFLLIFGVNKFIKPFKLPKVLSILSLSLTGFFVFILIFIGTLPDNIFKLKRDFDYEELDSGYKITFQYIRRPSRPD